MDFDFNYPSLLFVGLTLIPIIVLNLCPREYRYSRMACWLPLIVLSLIYTIYGVISGRLTDLMLAAPCLVLSVFGAFQAYTLNKLQDLFDEKNERLDELARKSETARHQHIAMKAKANSLKTQFRE